MRKILLFSTLFLLNTWCVAAGWELDSEKSSIHFTSTKNDTIKEESTFKKMTGSIDAKGHATLNINLNSVDTRIPVRDERMRELLFETIRFPEATFETNISAEQWKLLSDKKPHTLPLAGTLSLHGMQHDISTQVIAQQIDDNTLKITQATPIVLDTNDYQLESGVGVLTKIVGLKSISNEVPVTFTLMFKRV